MLLVHWMRRAASRADWTAGSNSAISTAMMAMTTKSSINVKPRRCSHGNMSSFARMNVTKGRMTFSGLQDWQ